MTTMQKRMDTLFEQIPCLKTITEGRVEGTNALSRPRKQCILQVILAL